MTDTDYLVRSAIARRQLSEEDMHRFVDIYTSPASKRFYEAARNSVEAERPLKLLFMRNDVPVSVLLHAASEPRLVSLVANRPYELPQNVIETLLTHNQSGEYLYCPRYVLEARLLVKDVFSALPQRANLGSLNGLEIAIQPESPGKSPSIGAAPKY